MLNVNKSHFLIKKIKKDFFIVKKTKNIRIYFCQFVNVVYDITNFVILYTCTIKKFEGVRERNEMFACFNFCRSMCVCTYIKNIWV